MKEKLQFILSVSSAPFKKGIKGATNAVNNFKAKVSNAVKSMRTKLASLAKSPVAIGAAFTAMAYKIINSISESNNAFLEWEKSIAEVETLLGDKGLTKTVKDAFEAQAKMYGKKASEQAKAYYQLVSAGITDETKALKTLDVVNKLSVAGLANMGQTAKATTLLMNGFGVSAEKAGAALFATVKQGVTTLPELSSAIGRLASFSNDLNISMAEYTGIVGLLTTKLGNADKAATAFEAIIRGLLKPTTTARKEMAKYGEVVDATFLGKHGVQAAMVQLKKLSDLAGENSSKFFEGTETQKAFLAAMGAGPDVFKKYIAEQEKLIGSEKTLEQAFQKQAQTMDFRLKKVYAEIELLKQKLGESTIVLRLRIAELTKVYYLFATNVAEGFAKVQEPFGRFINLLKSFTDRINSFASAANPSLLLLKGFIALFDKLFKTRQDTEAEITSSFENYEKINEEKEKELETEKKLNKQIKERHGFTTEIINGQVHYIKKEGEYVSLNEKNLDTLKKRSEELDKHISKFENARLELETHKVIVGQISDEEKKILEELKEKIKTLKEQKENIDEIYNAVSTRLQKEKQVSAELSKQKTTYLDILRLARQVQDMGGPNVQVGGAPGAPAPPGLSKQSWKNSSTAGGGGGGGIAPQASRVDVNLNIRGSDALGKEIARSLQKGQQNNTSGLTVISGA